VGSGIDRILAPSPLLPTVDFGRVLTLFSDDAHGGKTIFAKGSHRSARAEVTSPQS
jgi:hypothetical protein